MASKDYESGISFIGANDLRVGKYVMLRDQPCKIVELHKSNPGKHGSAKIRIVGLHVFTGKKYDDLFQASEMATVPVVTKTDYEVLEIPDDGSLIVKKGSQVRKDLHLPTEDDLRTKIVDMNRQIKSGQRLLITVLSALDQEVIIAAKYFKR